MQSPFVRGIDSFNRHVIDKVIFELKAEYDQNGGLTSSNPNNYGMLGDDHVSIHQFGSNYGEDESSMADTLKQLKYLWEQRFQALCTQAAQRTQILANQAREQRHI